MKRIFLIGYMGSGKSTLGKLLAARFGLSFIDMDAYIEGRYRKSVNEIFRENGEADFRMIEKNTLDELGEIDNVVIATGGGAPCFHGNMDYMNTHGTTVYLDNSVPTLFKRLKKARSSRPLLKDKSDDELLSFIEEGLLHRKPFYNTSSLVFKADGIDGLLAVEKATEALCVLLEKDDFLLDRCNG